MRPEQREAILKEFEKLGGERWTPRYLKEPTYTLGGAPDIDGVDITESNLIDFISRALEILEMPREPVCSLRDDYGKKCPLCEKLLAGDIYNK